LRPASSVDGEKRLATLVTMRDGRQDEGCRLVISYTRIRRMRIVRAHFAGELRLG